MAAKGLENESDIEELTAWMDGELPPPRGQRVAERVRTDPDWRATWQDFQAVDAALNCLHPAEPPSDLTERIVRAARRREFGGRALRILAPLTAAAAVVLAVWLGAPSRPGAPGPAVDGLVARTLRDVPEADQVIVEKLPLFQNYQDVLSYEQVHSLVDGETLSALADLESKQDM